MDTRLAQALGLDDSHLVDEAHRPASIACPVHAGIVRPLLALQQAAREAGFDLQVVSGWRGFDRQRAIWNAKARGERPVMDDAGQAVDMAVLPPAQQVLRILRWSALPGASRHHWGTDIDVIDAAVLPEGYRVQLIVEEARGLCGAFHAWLDERIARDQAFGFYRPYAVDRGGIAPEPWHLSYRPLAMAYEQCLTPAALAEALSRAELCLADAVFADIDALFARFVRVA